MLTKFDKALLNLLQTGLPLAPQPYKVMGEQLGVDEDTVLASLRRLKALGYIRRMGAFFDSARLGYVSTLVAVRVAPQCLPAVAAAINAQPGVTHNYEREGDYNLWFAVTAPSQEAIEQMLQGIRELEGVEKLINLPATRRFKVSVEFNLQ
ncbi:MAG: AsnC family transcriptional regulator [Negativicutes bacterium]|nr:AsnC family transcriptional regulator [Negativicutes bacterium]